MQRLLEIIHYINASLIAKPHKRISVFEVMWSKSPVEKTPNYKGIQGRGGTCFLCFYPEDILVSVKTVDSEVPQHHK